MTLQVAPKPESAPKPGRALQPAEDPADYLHLSAVSWTFYEKMLDAVEATKLRVSFLDGEIEVIAPSAEHESRKSRLARLIEMTALEMDIELSCFGSTTFRRKARTAGLEPDECYYLRDNVERVRGMKSFDPKKHPAPDLAVEVEITHQVIDRLAIYARLGVHELWVDDGNKVRLLVLTRKSYRSSTKSEVFPFLSVTDLNKFLTRMHREPQNQVLRSLRTWLKPFQS